MPQGRPLVLAAAGAALLSIALSTMGSAGTPREVEARPESADGRPEVRAGEGAAPSWPSAPEFPSLNPSSWAGPPTSLASQGGRVVLLNVWTFGCVNCQRTLPWVRDVSGRYGGRGLTVIGVHSPEFDREKSLKRVEEARHAWGLAYPSFIDNEQLYWRALRNRYWPTIYLIDKRGRIRDVQAGEVHDGDLLARSLERRIESLLAEPD